MYAAKKSGKNTYRFAAAPDGNSLMTSTNSMEWMQL
jgi:hypothetical protein